MTGTSTVTTGDEVVDTRIRAEFAYEVIAATEDEFTIASRIRTLRIETPDEVLGYGADETETPLYLTALVEAANSVRVTYDARWNVVRVRGFGRFVEKMLDRAGDVPGRIGDLLGPVVETVLGPIATAIVRDRGAEDFPGRLFQAGTVKAGDEWSTLEDSEIVATTQRGWKIDSIDLSSGRRVCNTTSTLEIDYRGLMELVGYQTQTMESRTAFLANGLPVSATTRAGMTLTRPADTKVATEFLGLAYEGTDDETAKQKVESVRDLKAIPYPLAIGTEATRDLVPEFRGYPTTLFIDRSGQVRLALTGYQDPVTLEAIAKVLLAEETD